MASSASDNTTRLSSMSTGLTVRNFTDIRAKMVSKAVAKQNYQKTMSDAKLNELRKAIYKMATGWSDQDKMRIIAEHGDASSTKNASSEELSRQLVETLIIGLNESDLKQILTDVKVEEVQLRKEVRDIQKNRRRAATYFSTRTFEQVYETAKFAKEAKDVVKARREYDRSYRVPKYITSKYGSLKRELLQVLKEMYNKIELAGLADSMGINVPGETNYKELTLMIVNKVLLYVDLIVGNTRRGYATSVINKDPYNELLQYTTFGFVTGKIGLKLGELDLLRKNARRARQSVKEGFKMRESGAETTSQRMLRQSKDIRNSGGLLSLLSPILSPLLAAGGNIANVPGAIGRAGAGVLGGGIGGILGGLGGGIGGIFKGKGILGSAANAQMGAARGAGVGSAFLRGGFGGFRDILDKQVGQGLYEQQLNKIKNDKGEDYLESKTNEELIEIATKYGVSVNVRGRINRENLKERIYRAIANQDARKQRLQQEKIKEEKKGRIFAPKKQAELDAVIQMQDRALGREEPDTKGTMIPYVNFRNSVLVEKDILRAVPVYVINQAVSNANAAGAGSEKGFVDSKLDIMSNKSGREMGRMRNYASLYSLVKDYLPAHSTRLNKDGDVDAVFIQGSYLKKKTLEKILKKTGGYSYKDSFIVKLPQTSINPVAYDTGVRESKKEPATPVLIVNDAVKTTSTAEKILLQIASKFFRVDIDAISDLADAKSVGTLISSGRKLLGLATGGTGLSAGNKASHFISGDSLSSRPNPEQVSIDWSRKSYNVKPIPQFAEGGAGSASGLVKRMNESERSKPMSVGISSHTVTYTKALQDVKDDGSNQAIKVYSVNNSLTEMYDINGTSVSLMGLVANISGRLANIEGLLSVGNQQQQGILAATMTTATNTKASSGGGNPFTSGGFPSNINNILKGT